MHSKEFAGNQGKRQKFDPSILPYKFGLIFMRMKQKQVKDAFFVFLGCFCPYVRQHHDHIGWATLMAFASINPTDQPVKFSQKKFENWRFWKTEILKDRPFWFFFLKKIFFFASFSWKSIQICMVDWRFPWFPANSLLCVIKLYTVYVLCTSLNLSMLV